MKILNIVSWVLVLVLLIGVGALAFLYSQQSGRAAGLSDAFSQVAATAGVQDLESEALKDPAQLPDVLQQVQTAIQAGQEELTSTKDALATSQSDASGAQAEVATLKQGVQEQTTKAEAAATDLAAKEEELAEAKAASETAAEALKAAEEQKTELEGNLESLKTQMAEETTQLQADLDAALQQVEAFEAAMPTDDLSEEPEGEMQEDAVAEEEVMEEPEVAEDEGELLGTSRMFSQVRYVTDTQVLFLRLLDGQTLTYQEVPSQVVDQLVHSYETLDVVYRFKIQGAYKCSPSDSIVVRKFWKGQRHRPKQSDVRVSIVEPAPVVEEEVAPEEENPEETVSEEEAAPADEEAVEEVVSAEEVVVEEAPAEEDGEDSETEEAPAAE